MTRHAIRKVFILSAFKYGAVLGAVLLILPGLLSGLAARSFIHTLRQMMDSFGAGGALIPGGADAARFLDQIKTLDDMGSLLVVWITVGTIVVGGIIEGVMAALAAVVYNLIAAVSGGLEVGLETLGSGPAMVSAGAGPAAGPARSAPGLVPTVPQLPPVRPFVAGAAMSPAYQPVAQPPAAQPGQPECNGWLVSAQAPGRPWGLRAGVTRIGSAQDNDIALPALAAHHAEVHLEANRYILYDLSGGQVWVNDRVIQGKNMLKEGFRVRIGGYELTYHGA